MRFHSLVGVVVLASAQWLCSQEMHQKKPSAGESPEQKATDTVSGKVYNQPCELTTCVTKVFYLSNLSQPSELQDFVNSLRTIAEIARVQQVPSEQMVIVKGTPEQIAMAEKLADEIDKGKRRFGELGYRIDLKIVDLTTKESRGDKKLVARSYSIVTEAGQTSRLSLGRQAPPIQGGAAGAKPSLDIGGGSIEYRILTVGERTVELNIDLAFPACAACEAGKEDKSAPALETSTQLKVRDHVTLELGRATVISMVDDPNDGRSFQIELTVSRIKGTS